MLVDIHRLYKYSVEGDIEMIEEGKGIILLLMSIGAGFALAFILLVLTGVLN